MVFGINKRKETKTGLQVRPGVGDLRLDEDLGQGGVAFAKARQKLAIFGASGLPRRTDLCLGEYSFA